MGFCLRFRKGKSKIKPNGHEWWKTVQSQSLSGKVSVDPGAQAAEEITIMAEKLGEKNY
jgi:hypothetical protein